MWYRCSAPGEIPLAVATTLPSPRTGLQQRNQPRVAIRLKPNEDLTDREWPHLRSEVTAAERRRAAATLCCATSSATSPPRSQQVCAVIALPTLLDFRPTGQRRMLHPLPRPGSRPPLPPSSAGSSFVQSPASLPRIAPAFSAADHHSAHRSSPSVASARSLRHRADRVGPRRAQVTACMQHCLQMSVTLRRFWRPAHQPTPNSRRICVHSNAAVRSERSRRFAVCETYHRPPHTTQPRPRSRFAGRGDYSHHHSQDPVLGSLTTDPTSHSRDPPPWPSPTGAAIPRTPDHSDPAHPAVIPTADGSNRRRTFAGDRYIAPPLVMSAPDTGHRPCSPGAMDRDVPPLGAVTPFHPHAVTPRCCRCVRAPCWQAAGADSTPKAVPTIPKVMSRFRCNGTRSRSADKRADHAGRRWWLQLPGTVACHRRNAGAVAACSDGMPSIVLECGSRRLTPKRRHPRPPRKSISHLHSRKVLSRPHAIGPFPCTALSPPLLRVAAVHPPPVRALP